MTVQLAVVLPVLVACGSLGIGLCLLALRDVLSPFVHQHSPPYQSRKHRKHSAKHADEKRSCGMEATSASSQHLTSACPHWLCTCSCTAAAQHSCHNNDAWGIILNDRAEMSTVVDRTVSVRPNNCGQEGCLAPVQRCCAAWATDGFDG